MTQEEYDAKREAKKERFERLAEKAKDESAQRYSSAMQMARTIDGQPILIGHHSEKRHRRDIERMDNNMRKSCELDDKAKYFERRADAIESNRAIFSDDPSATEQIGEKIKRLEEQQRIMREFNKALRKDDMESMLNLGFSEQQILKLKTPDWCGRVGFADYKMTNNNANIRRLKQRLGKLQTQQSAETTEKTINGIKIIDNVEENRLQMFFDGKPTEEIREKLKHSGFHWTPSSGCWQRFRSNGAMYQAEQIAGTMNKQHHTVKVSYANGDTVTTEINGTEQEVREYFAIGNSFNLGREGDNMQKVTGLEFI